MVFFNGALATASPARLFAVDCCASTAAFTTGGHNLGGQEMITLAADPHRGKVMTVRCTECHLLDAKHSSGSLHSLSRSYAARSTS